MLEPIYCTENIITAEQLLKRWPGLSEPEFLDHLEKLANGTPSMEFPQVFWAKSNESTKRNPETGELATYIFQWDSKLTHANSELKDFGRLIRGKHDYSLLERIIFKLDEILIYEKNNYDQLYSESVSTSTSYNRYIKNNHNVTMKSIIQENTKLKRENDHLLSAIENKSGGKSHRDKWKLNIRIACSLIAEIVEQENEKGVIKDEFVTRFEQLCLDHEAPITKIGEVISAAWQGLPEAYKKGPGAPEKK